MPANQSHIPDYESLLLEAKRSMEADLNFASPRIPNYILQSWRRSRSYGILTTDEKLICATYDHSQVDEIDRYLAEVAGDEIDAIWDSFGGENWVVYCTNAQALITGSSHLRV
uniref:hypothetical protein n=1 Tax=Pseudomonas fluorescens TaxID=294 RepID=UPI00155DD406|nr:hypothetical protein [Pseudomonas fluorescens]